MNLNLDWKELNEIDVNGQFELFVDVDNIQDFVIKNKGDFFELNQNFPDYNRFEGLCEQMNEGTVSLSSMESRCLNLFDISVKQFKLEVLSFIANEFYNLKINEVDIVLLRSFIRKAKDLNEKIDTFGDRVSWDVFMDKISKLTFYGDNVIGSDKYNQELRVKEIHFNNHISKDELQLK